MVIRVSCGRLGLLLAPTRKQGYCEIGGHLEKGQYPTEENYGESRSFEWNHHGEAWHVPTDTACLLSPS